MQRVSLACDLHRLQGSTSLEGFNSSQSPDCQGQGLVANLGLGRQSFKTSLSQCLIAAVDLGFPGDVGKVLVQALSRPKMAETLWTGSTFQEVMLNGKFSMSTSPMSG